MSLCYIVGAGYLAPDTVIEEGYVIAADGGYDSLLKLGIRPDLIIGDLDSISTKVQEGVEVIPFPVRKDYTDTHLAYLEGVRRGYTSFVILGGTGGMPDHTFANYSLLLHSRRQGHSVVLKDDTSCARMIENQEIILHGCRGKRISVFAFGAVAKGVSVEGAEYTAQDIELTPDFPLGVSNAFLKEEVRVSVKDGSVLIFTEN